MTSQRTHKNPSQTVPVQWISDLKTTEEKEEFIKLLSYNQIVLRKLKTILEARMEERSKTSLTISDFDNPNWSHKEAFRNGEKTALRDVLNLLNFIKD